MTLMTFDVEIVLRERDLRRHRGNPHEQTSRAQWTEPDVEQVLKSMLLAIDRVKNPGATSATWRSGGSAGSSSRPDGGVVIAIEIPSGAAVAGPFDDRSADAGLPDRPRPRRRRAGPPVVH